MRRPINLATNPFVDYRRFALTAGLLAVVALLLTVLVLVEGIGAWRERSRAQTRLRELETRRAELAREQQRLESELQVPETLERLERVRFLNQLIQQKDLSWAQLFFDVQERLPARVRVLSLSPKLREDGRLQVELRVGGEAAAVVIEFLRALEDGKKFHEVVLRSQSHVEGESADPVTADVSAVYVQE